MEKQYARKQKSRRVTEFSQNSVKLVEEGEVQPPVVKSEIFEYLSHIINPGNAKKVIHHSIIKLVKVSTNST